MTTPLTPDIQKQIEEVASRYQAGHSNSCSYPEGCECGALFWSRQLKIALTEIAQPLAEKIEKLQQLVGPLEQYRLRMECACTSGTATQIQMLINEAELQREVTTQTQEQLTALQARFERMKEAGDESRNALIKNISIHHMKDCKCESCKAITNWRNVTKEL